MSRGWCKDWFISVSKAHLNRYGQTAYTGRPPATAEDMRTVLVAAACDLMPKAHAALAAAIRLGERTQQVRVELWHHDPVYTGWPGDGAAGRDKPHQHPHWHVALRLPGFKRRRWIGSIEGRAPVEGAVGLLGWPLRTKWRARP